MLELGHPWIIADTWTRRWPTGKQGDLIPLVDSSGRFLATALLDPPERIVARVLDVKRHALDRGWLRERLLSAFALRERHAALGDT